MRPDHAQQLMTGCGCACAHRPHAHTAGRTRRASTRSHRAPHPTMALIRLVLPRAHAAQPNEFGATRARPAHRRARLGTCSTSRRCDAPSPRDARRWHDAGALEPRAGAGDGRTRRKTIGAARRRRAAAALRRVCSTVVQTHCVPGSIESRSVSGARRRAHQSWRSCAKLADAIRGLGEGVRRRASGVMQRREAQH